MKITPEQAWYFNEQPKYYDVTGMLTNLFEKIQKEPKFEHLFPQLLTQALYFPHIQQHENPYFVQGREFLQNNLPWMQVPFPRDLFRHLQYYGRYYRDRGTGNEDALRRATPFEHLRNIVNVYEWVRHYNPRLQQYLSHAVANLKYGLPQVEQNQLLRQQSKLLRSLYGSPFHEDPKFSPRILQWNDRTIPKMVEGIQTENRYQDAPVLADALEESGYYPEHEGVYDPIEHLRKNTVFPGDHIMTQIARSARNLGNKT